MSKRNNMRKVYFKKIKSGNLYTELNSDGVINHDYFDMLPWVGRSDCIHIYDNVTNTHDVYLEIPII